MNRKKLAGAGAVAIGAATAVTALLIGSTAAVAEEGGPASSAYGIAASGLLQIAPVPSVESTDGEPVHDELLRLGPDKNLSAGLLTVDALGGAARTSVADVDVQGLLEADLVTTSCQDGKGALEIVNGSVLGRQLPRHPVRGQVIDLAPLLRLTLGDETRNADDSITVTGIEVTVLPGHADRNAPLTDEQKKALPGLADLLGVPLPPAPTVVGDVLDPLAPVGGHALQKITIGSATCGAGEQAEEPQPASDEPAPPAGDEAPRPEIVQADLPVTG